MGLRITLKRPSGETEVLGEVRGHLAYVLWLMKNEQRLRQFGAGCKLDVVEVDEPDERKEAASE